MAHAKNHDYHILPPSIWPMATSIAAVIMLSGAILWLKGTTMYMFLAGFAAVLFCMFGWWSAVIKESTNNEHNSVIRISLRMGVIMFIIS